MLCSSLQGFNMKLPFRLFPFLLCLWLMGSSIEVSATEQPDFDFLTHYNNGSIVEDGLALAKSSSGLSFSVLANLGFWYAVCKAIEFASELLPHRFGSQSSRMQKPEALNSGYCLQLAPVIVATEVALAGHISPWPLEQTWWQLLRMSGMGITIYKVYKATRNELIIPVALTFFAAEASARTVGSAMSTRILRSNDNMDINPADYDYAQFAALSLISGLMIGSGIYQVLINRRFSYAWARSVFAISVTITGVLPVIVTDYELNSNVRSTTRAGVTTAILASVIITESGTRLKAVTGASSGALAGVIAGAAAALFVITYTEMETRIYEVTVLIVTAVIALGGAASIIVALAEDLFILDNPNTRLDSTITTSVGYALVSASAFALMNSLSSYEVYGYPLEESLYEMAWTQWKKFYALPDYFSTLFNCH